MKLILCLDCTDMRKLQKEKTFCNCGQSWGWYKEDGWNAVIGGSSIPIGIDNITLRNAILNRPKNGLGLNFLAWVFPEKTERVRKEKKKSRNIK